MATPDTTGTPTAPGSHDSVPSGIDVTIPSVARMYDYYLGGKDHFAADRDAANEIIAVVPEVPKLARANRAFLGRAVRYLASDCGIAQFIDLGTGLPTQDNVHQVAHRVDPTARVVYVDNDPVVLAHARALLADNDTTIAIEADLRDPATVLKHPELAGLIDFDRPVAVLCVAVLHFVDNADDPAGIVSAYHGAVAPGSYLALSHATWGRRHAEVATAAAEVYQRATSPIILRAGEEITALFGGFELVEPGLVEVQDWRSDGPVTELDAAGRILAGIGRAR